MNPYCEHVQLARTVLKNSAGTLGLPSCGVACPLSNFADPAWRYLSTNSYVFEMAWKPTELTNEKQRHCLKLNVYVQKALLLTMVGPYGNIFSTGTNIIIHNTLLTASEKQREVDNNIITSSVYVRNPVGYTRVPCVPFVD